MQAESVALFMQPAPYNHLRFGVLRADAAHVVAALLLCVYICHAAKIRNLLLSGIWQKRRYCLVCCVFLVVKGFLNTTPLCSPFQGEMICPFFAFLCVSVTLREIASVYDSRPFTNFTDFTCRSAGA